MKCFGHLFRFSLALRDRARFDIWCWTDWRLTALAKVEKEETRSRQAMAMGKNWQIKLHFRFDSSLWVDFVQDFRDIYNAGEQKLR